MARMQRARLLAAIAAVVAERGYANTTVKSVTARAGVSSRTFYQLFAGLEDCFSAVLDLGLERAGELLTEAFKREDRWQDAMRTALASLLTFFDSEPLLARVWFIESMAAGSWALERRERNAALLRSTILEHWATLGGEQPEPFTAAAAMAAVLGLIHTHLLTRQREPLIELLGPLIGVVMTPYLDQPSRTREIERGAQLARRIQAGDPRWTPARALAHTTPHTTLPAILREPNAHRAWECLVYLAHHPDSSNRQVAAGIGVAHDSQISSLLARLAGEHLASKNSKGAGKRNAWRLTSQGEDTLRLIKHTWSLQRKRLHDQLAGPHTQRAPEEPSHCKPHSWSFHAQK